MMERAPFHHHRLPLSEMQDALLCMQQIFAFFLKQMIFHAILFPLSSTPSCNRGAPISNDTFSHTACSTAKLGLRGPISCGDVVCLIFASICRALKRLLAVKLGPGSQMSPFSSSAVLGLSSFLQWLLFRSIPHLHSIPPSGNLHAR